MPYIIRSPHATKPPNLHPPPPPSSQPSSEGRHWLFHGETRSLPPPPWGIRSPCPGPSTPRFPYTHSPSPPTRVQTMETLTGLAAPVHRRHTLQNTDPNRARAAHPAPPHSKNGDRPRPGYIARYRNSSRRLGPRGPRGVGMKGDFGPRDTTAPMSAHARSPRCSPFETPAHPSHESRSDSRLALASLRHRVNP